MCSASCSVLQAYGPSTTTQRYPCAARTPRLSARAAEDSARLTAVKKKIPTMLVIAIFKIGKTAVAAAPGRLVMIEVSTTSFSPVVGFTVGRISALLVFIFQLCGCAPSGVSPKFAAHSSVRYHKANRICYFCPRHQPLYLGLCNDFSPALFLPHFPYIGLSVQPR